MIYQYKPLPLDEDSIYRKPAEIPQYECLWCRKPAKNIIGWVFDQGHMTCIDCKTLSDSQRQILLQQKLEENGI